MSPPHTDRRCDWPGCEDAGEHRAPRSRQDLNSYYWFCLGHVKVYNASWNYYEGMSEEEVEADRRRDTVWQRPSWRLGTRMGRSRQSILEDVIDDLGVLREDGHDRPDASTTQRRSMVATSEERAALEVLDLRPPLTVAVVKARYKVLVKLHHPDTNGGDKGAEERFKEINQAYKIIMATLTP